MTIFQYFQKRDSIQNHQPSGFIGTNAHERVAATGDLFLRQFSNIWLVFAVSLWILEISTTPHVQYPGAMALFVGIAAEAAISYNRMWLARYFIVGFMSAFVLIFPFFTNGVRTPALFGFAPLILLCGWLIGRRAANILTALFCSFILIFWQIEAHHWLTFDADQRPPTEWMLALISVCVITALAVSYMIKNIESNFDQQEILKEQLSASLKQTQQLSDALETVPSYIYMKDDSGRYTYVNKPLCELFGCSVQDILGATNEKFLDLSISDDSRKNDRRVLELGEHIESEEINVIAGTNETKYYWVVNAPIRDASGTITGMYGIANDITERKRIQIELKQAQQAAESANLELSAVAKFNETIMLNSPLPMGVYMDDGQCVSVNDAFVNLVGTTREAMMAQNFNDIKEWQTSGVLECCIKAFTLKTPQQLEARFVTLTGNEVFAECRMLPIQLNKGDHILIQLIDLTDRKLQEMELSKFAFTDALTHLPNRRMFLERLKHAVINSKRSNDYGAMLFLDLNKFKQLNDTHGHEAGDQLLIEVAKRLKLTTRESDSIARFGGDEFAVLLESVGADPKSAFENASTAANKIKAALSEEYVLDEISHHGSASVGIAIFLGDKVKPEQIIKEADAAMYEVKKSR